MASLSELTGIPGSQSSSGRTSAGAATTPNSKFFRKIDQIKTQLLSPSLTSYFQCEINLPEDFVKWVKNRSLNIDTTIKDLINLSCSDASLPGSSLMTNEITDDYTGVTERHAYRRQYDDRADFTFYVDGNNYNIIYLFDSWLSYITNENLTGDYSVTKPNFNYRINYPQSYRNDIYIHKFEKSMSGSVLTYRFYDAYPISISSMPVSYDSVSLLKCTVSFTYLRYVVQKSTHTTTPGEFGNREPSKEKAEILGTPSVPTQNPTLPSFSEAINLNLSNLYQSSSYITNFSNASLTDNFNTSFSGSGSNFTQLPQGVGGASGQYASILANSQLLSSASSQQTAGGVAGVPQLGGVAGVPQPGGVAGVPQPVPSVTIPLTGQTLSSALIPGLGLQSTPAQLSQYTRYPLSAPYSGGINPSLFAPVPSLGGVLPGYGFINNGFQLNVNEIGETIEYSFTGNTELTPRTPTGRPPIIGNGTPPTNSGGTEPPLW